MLTDAGQAMIDEANRAASVLDLRLERDDIDTAAVRERISRANTGEIWLRPEQVRSLMRAGYYPDELRPRSIWGVPIVEHGDGLTPRERSIKRALREFPPTRQEQVAAELARREAAREEIAGSRRFGESLFEATRKLGEAARSGTLAMDGYASHIFNGLNLQQGDSLTVTETFTIS